MARMLSISHWKRDVLIEHMDGRRVPVMTAASFTGQEAITASRRLVTLNSLLRLGYLSTGNQIKPRYTVITDRGRAVLAKVLAEYAEILHRAEIAKLNEGFPTPRLDKGDTKPHGRPDQPDNHLILADFLPVDKNTTASI